MPAISIRNISKKYKRGTGRSYVALRDVVGRSLKNIFSKQNGAATFWALKDINLEIQQGERLGIIGPNGAGKSTLLKIISRITPPTAGRITLQGRVASLLEVGTGFHPELTGRENIYLNGSILGLKKAEINARRDEIIDFSGVGAFIDSPLKNFSTGMQLRLAFSVAAHLEPEILLIDEVLAVGDMEFQKKCIGKMEEVSKAQGRTILFVSHDLNYITALSDRCILLKNGSMERSGNVKEVVSHYLHSMLQQAGTRTWQEHERPGNEVVRLRSLRLIDQTGHEKQSFRADERIGIEMQYEVLQQGPVLWLGHNIFNHMGVNVFDTHSVSSPFYTQPHEKGIYSGTSWIPGALLNTGTYTVGSAIFNHLQNKVHLHERNVLAFQVHEVFDVPTARGMSAGDFPGVIRPLLQWDIKKIHR